MKLTLEYMIREARAAGPSNLEPYFSEAMSELTRSRLEEKGDIATVLAWIMKRSYNQSVEIGRAAEAVANHAILRKALEDIAEPVGCGCSGICRCFSGEGGRDIVMGIQDIAKEALANVPHKPPRKAVTIPQELTGTRVGSFTLAELPEGVKSPPTPPRLEGTPIPLMRDRQLVDAARSVLAECASRGLLIHGIDMPKFAKG